MIDVRPAKEEDLVYHLVIAERFHKMGHFGEISKFNPDVAFRHGQYCLNNKNKLYLSLVDRETNIPCGYFIAGRQRPVWSDEEWWSSEEQVYVLEEFRHKGGARACMRAFKEWEKWCRSFNCMWMYFAPTSFTENNDRRWDSFCRVAGFEIQGRNYSKALSYD